VIVADMISQWATTPDDATAFWSLVFTESHPNPNHVTRLLAAWFREQLAASKQPRLDLESFRRKTRKLWRVYQSEKDRAAA
jgi:hypothetical protein